MAKSHLLQMRGLKLPLSGKPRQYIRVASFTDAWIETRYGISSCDLYDVASFTDAWIET